MDKQKNIAKRMSVSGALLAALCVACLGLLPGCRSTPDQDLEAALEADSRADAMRLLNRAVAKDPQFVEALMARARLHASAQAFDESIEDYDRVLELMQSGERTAHTTRQRADVLYMRGKVLELAGRLEEAAQGFTAAMRADPALISPLEDRAWVFFQMGEYDQSMQDYALLLSQEMTHLPDEARERRAELRLRRGAAAFCSQNWESAVADFETAYRDTRSAARQAQALINLYIVACRIDDREQAHEALSNYAENIRRRSADGSPWNFNVVWHLEGTLSSEDLLEAAEHSRRSVEAERTAIAHYYIGARHLIQGNPQAAAEAFERAVTHKDRSLIEYHMAKVELDRARAGGATVEDYKARARRAETPEEKINLYTHALRIQPDDLEARLRRALYYSLSDRHDEALEDYDLLLEQLELPENRAQTFRYRAWTYTHRGEYEKALEDYNAALELEPDSWQAREGAAAVLCFLREYERAAEIYGGLIEDVEAERRRRDFWTMQLTFANACHGAWEAAAEGLRELIRRAGDPALLRANLYIAESKLGDGEAAAERLKQFAGQIREQSWPNSVVWFLAGRIDAQKLLEGSMHEDEATHALRTARSFYYIGQQALLRGEREQAVELMESSVRLGEEAQSESWEYRMAREELRRLRAE